MENQEIIRVFIVDNNPETREKVRTHLKMEKGIDIVGVARTGKEAVDLVQESEPDVVILDVNTPDMDEIALTEAICRRVPFCQVIILAVQVDPNYMRRAMLAGARDFIVKPPLPDELRSAVYRAGGLAHERRDNSIRALPQKNQESQTIKPANQVNLGKIIVVYGPKGGVGTTTIATNLAVALQQQKQKSIIIDGNLQYGDVAVFLNETGYHSILDLTPRVDDLDPEIISSVTLNHPKTGLDVIIAPSRPEYAEKVTGEEFYKVLQYLRRMYANVFVDTTTSLNDITLAAIDAADLIVVVLGQEIAAIRNTRMFLAITDGLHIHRQRMIVVMNKFDKRIALTPEKVSDNLKQEIVSIIPEDSIIAKRSANQGIPLILDYRNEPIGKSLMDLSEIVSTRLASMDTSDPAQVKIFKTP
jgi:pilus assembly protein CpaE